MTINRLLAILALSLMCVSCASSGSHRTAHVKAKGAQSHGVHFEGSF